MMGAPYIDEMLDYMLEHGARDDCERDLLVMAKDLGIKHLDSLLLSLNNGIHKGYWKIVPADTPTP